MSVVWTFLGGKLVQEVTSITLVNNTEKLETASPGTGKRWLLLGVRMLNPDDVNRVLVIDKYKEAAKTNLVKRLVVATLGPAGAMQWPYGVPTETEKRSGTPPEILEAGNTLEFKWSAGGASTGGTDADGLVVEYLEIDL